MPSTTSDSAPPKAPSQRAKGEPHRIRERYPWLFSHISGYIAAFLLVSLLFFLEKIDERIPQVSLFIGAPFALLAILIALVWGTGPALIALGLGLIVVLNFVPSEVLSADLVRDIIILAPFLLLQVVAIVTVIRLEHSHKELQQSRQQLEQANAQKDYVLTRAAHEFRTPLTTILGRTQLLLSRIERSGETHENWAATWKYLKVVEVRALRLRALIDSLFDLSHSRMEDIASQFSLCDLGDLCREIIENQQTLSGRQIELEFPTYPILLQADEKRLAQVLTNLLNNALQYSPAHTAVHVRVHAESDSVTLRVQNEGVALATEQLDRLFEPFYRVPSVEYSSIPGWGLGLTISKEIVERHGGKIWVEASSVGSITFFVNLPLPKEVA